MLHSHTLSAFCCFTLNLNWRDWVKNQMRNPSAITINSFRFYPYWFRNPASIFSQLKKKKEKNTWKCIAALAEPTITEWVQQTLGDGLDFKAYRQPFPLQFWVTTVKKNAKKKSKKSTLLVMWKLFICLNPNNNCFLHLTNHPSVHFRPNNTVCALLWAPLYKASWNVCGVILNTELWIAFVSSWLVYLFFFNSNVTISLL